MSNAWSKNMIIDRHTFGGTLACEILAEMMNRDVIPPYQKHKVLSFLNMAIHRLHSLSTMKDSRNMAYIFQLVKQDILLKIDMMDYDPKFRSYMKNVICHHCRRIIEDKL